jgi:hypothetical protein
MAVSIHHTHGGVHYSHRSRNLFAVAVRLRIPARELGQVLFAYPTSGSDVRFML